MDGTFVQAFPSGAVYRIAGGAAGLPLRVSAQVRDIDLAQAVPVQRYPGFHFAPPRGNSATTQLQMRSPS